jgi:hypothetical protein
VTKIVAQNPLLYGKIARDHECFRPAPHPSPGTFNIVYHNIVYNGYNGYNGQPNRD